MSSYGDPPRGRAQVPATGYDFPTSPPPVGRASVPNSGGYTYDDEPSVPGRTVGRASVRPVVPTSPGGPYVPPQPRPVAGAPRPPRRSKRKRRNWILAAFAVFIMLAGAAVVGGTWYYDEVPKVTDFDVPEATTIFFNDGKSQLAKLGEVNRTIVPIGEIPVHVRYAVVSAEDRKFFEHGGIDIQGIARAAWNNVTGGETQGASTITQQYARNVADLSGITYARKIREAVIANKMERDLSKDDILYHYLNAIYFGRGAHGVEAAALTFFGVSAKKLTIEQAAVLAAVIKQPEPRGNAKGYDPAYDPEAAKDRWGYVLDGLVELKQLDAAKRAAMQYPKVNPYDPAKPTCAIDCGINQPTGNVINYVRDEMEKLGFKDWKEGGYQITTSINPTMQSALEKTIRRSIPGSELAGQPANLMAAAVAVEPNTGRVLAYYGGEYGTGTDYAGWNWEGGKKTGGHPPGSSFKIYTLAAALKEGISMRTYWDATATKDAGFVISNAGRSASECGKSCTLEHSALQSYNVPFYWLTKKIGPGKVLNAAMAAGIGHMWNDADIEVVENAKSAASVAGNFHNQLGYGQYGVTVLDHANGAATFAARGVYRPAHFILEVKKKDEKTGQWLKKGGEKVVPKPVFDPNQVDDVVSVLSNYPTAKLSGGRQSARKTGTWELQGTKDNAHAWNIGFTPQVATAVWVGNVKGQQALKYLRDVRKPKELTSVQGANLPAEIWKRFMDEAHKGLPTKTFPERKNTGDDNHPAANGASPTPNPLPCPIPFLCPGPGPGNGGGGPGGGGGNNGPAGILPTPTPSVPIRRG